MDERGSPRGDEDAPDDGREPGGVHGDLLQHDPRGEITIAAGLDAAVALGAGTARLAVATVVAPASATAARVLRLGWHLLPGVGEHPVLTGIAVRGERFRHRLEHVAADALRALLRRTVDASLAAIDLTELVRAHVDLDAIAADLDVDAVIARADVDAVIARTDLDAIVATIDLDAVVDRIDVEAIVATIDLDAIVARVDLDRVASRIDIDAIIDRVDIDRIAAGIDLDAIVARVDPDAVIERVDVEAVLARLDLAGITRQVLEAIDLPGLLRESTGAVSSQAARVVRTEGMHADDSVARFVDRVLRRPPRAVPT
jgi:hypothetical protein